MRTRRLAFLFALFLPAAAAQQVYLNLDFETLTRGRPWLWTYSGTGYNFAADASTAFSGTQSFRIRVVNAIQGGSNVAQALPIDLVRGRHVSFSGYMKTDDITRAGAGLWLRVDGDTGTLAINNAPLGIINGTTDWQRFNIERDISPEAVAVYVGGFQFGNGTAWFDGFTVEVDGAPIPQLLPPNIGEPTTEQLDWVKRTAIPFCPPDAGKNLRDLSPVAGMVRKASIVGLGEGTHGTSEFFRMKHRLLEYLATEMGFTIFAIEANMPEAYLLNDYVLNGKGDPRKLLQGMYFWTWNTQEVLDMILWMREFNLSGKGPLQFTGFDMQVVPVAAANVRDFVSQADPSFLQTVDSALALATPVNTNYFKSISQTAAAVQPAVDAVHAVWQFLTEHRDGYLTRYPASAVDWAIQNARVLEQATYLPVAPGYYRDRSMAANIDWIMQQNPGAKIVLWAHDAHIERAGGSMGSYIARDHGTDYVAFGQIFHAGTYNAVNNRGVLVPNVATPSFPGTVEYILHATEIPRFFLDMRAASLADPSAWLLNSTQYRTIGSLAGDGFQFSYRLTQNYDVLIFFDETGPSQLLPFN